MHSCHGLNLVHPKFLCGSPGTSEWDWIWTQVFKEGVKLTGGHWGEPESHLTAIVVRGGQERTQGGDTGCKPWRGHGRNHREATEASGGATPVPPQSELPASGTVRGSSCFSLQVRGICHSSLSKDNSACGAAHPIPGPRLRVDAWCGLWAETGERDAATALPGAGTRKGRERPAMLLRPGLGSSGLRASSTPSRGKIRWGGRDLLATQDSSCHRAHGKNQGQYSQG